MNLTAVTKGKGVIDSVTRVSTVRIEANDAPHGVVQFAPDKYSSSEGSVATLLVRRMFGTSGAIRVLYR